MNMAAGLRSPTSGEVLVDGKPVTGPGPDRGVIFQQYALFPWLTVRAERRVRARSWPPCRAAERRRRAEHAIDLVGLTDFADALPKTLSGGMKQRCAIARAYAVDPQVLLMDEPFGALDALTRVQLQDQLLRHLEPGAAHGAVHHPRRGRGRLSGQPRRGHGRPARADPPVIEVDLPYPRTEEPSGSPPSSPQIRNAVWTAVYHQTPAATTAA